ncbi:hypothetical protein GCM10027577_31830 [Spirosoma fluminis]
MCRLTIQSKYIWEALMIETVWLAGIGLKAVEITVKPVGMAYLAGEPVAFPGTY